MPQVAVFPDLPSIPLKDVVLIQGFGWDSWKKGGEEGWWAKLEEKVPDLAVSFVSPSENDSTSLCYVPDLSCVLSPTRNRVDEDAQSIHGLSTPHVNAHESRAEPPSLPPEYEAEPPSLPPRV